MAPQVGRILGNDHEMSHSCDDGARAPRAQVGLAGGIRLDDRDDLYPQRAHARTPTVTTSAITTTTMSVMSRSCDRNGLKPTAGC